VMSAEVWHKAHAIASEQVERIRSGKWGGGHEPNPGLAAAIANFVIDQVKAEREACAQIADEHPRTIQMEVSSFEACAIHVKDEIAAAIRHRSNLP